MAVSRLVDDSNSFKVPLTCSESIRSCTSQPKLENVSPKGQVSRLYWAHTILSRAFSQSGIQEVATCMVNPLESRKMAVARYGEGTEGTYPHGSSKRQASLGNT
jgi:hypothetical protein